MKVIVIYCLLLPVLAVFPLICTAQWTHSTLSDTYQITDIMQSGSLVYVATSNNGIVRSQNLTDWTPSGSGITTNNVVELISVVEQGSYLSFYAATEAGAFRSTMLGYSWTPINNGISDLNLSTIYGDGTFLFAGTLGAAFRSDNYGQSWMPVTIGSSNQIVTCFLRNGSDLLAGLTGSGNYLYRSTDNGLSWQPYGSGLYEIQQISKLDDELFAVSGTVLYHSVDNGATWTQVGPGLVPGMYITDLFPFGDYLYVATMAGGYVQHTDSVNFRLITAGMPMGGSMLSAVSANDEWVAFGTMNAGLWYATTEILTGSKEQHPLASEIKVVPNPLSSNSAIIVTLKNAADVSFRITDMTGKILIDKSLGFLVPGTNRIALDAERLNPGTYLLAIQTGLHQRYLLLIKP